MNSRGGWRLVAAASLLPAGGQCDTQSSAWWEKVRGSEREGKDEAAFSAHFMIFITKPLQLIPPTISHFPLMKNTYIPIVHWSNCILDPVDVFIAWENVALTITLGQ